MLLLSLTSLAALSMGLGWLHALGRAGSRGAAQQADQGLAVELALWMQANPQRESSGDAAQSWRCTERAALVAGLLGIDPGPLRLAAALPPGLLGARDVHLPEATRAALAFRHARWDGAGIPRGLAGDAIPLAAQALAVVDWLELRDDAFDLGRQIRAESGRRFSPRLVERVVGVAEALAAIRSPDLVGGYRVLRGALLCVTPAVDGECPEVRGAVIRAIAEQLRARLRPADRVRQCGEDLVVWLKDCDADGVNAVQFRLRPAIAEVKLPGDRAVPCTFGVALADTDATSFAELLSIARTRRAPVGAAQRAA